MNRRRYPRVQLKMRCRATIVPRNGAGDGTAASLTGATRDVSRGGLLLELDPYQPCPLEVGDYVRVDIDLPPLARDLARSLYCEGLIVRVEPASQGGVAGAVSIQRMEFRDQPPPDFTAAAMPAGPGELLM